MLLCVALAAGLNVGLSALPAGVRPPAGAAMLVSGLVAAGVCAVLFPAKRREDGGDGKGAAR